MKAGNELFLNQIFIKIYFNNCQLHIMEQSLKLHVMGQTGRGAAYSA